jgi:chaperonin cofactor prefoldin
MGTQIKTQMGDYQSKRAALVEQLQQIESQVQLMNRKRDEVVTQIVRTEGALEALQKLLEENSPE